MKVRTQSLPSFASWINKGFDIRGHAGRMSDMRNNPEISPASIFLTLFHSFVFRLPSFQQIESDLTHSYLQQWVGAERAFRDDTLRYSLCGFDLKTLEACLVDINRRFKRGKVFDQGRIQGRLVAALDGIEVLSSYSRRCDDCLERQVSVRDQAGRKRQQTQYYHRAVGCQIIHSPVKPFLAIEWVRPGESEDTAALRLLTRLPEMYGSRFFDILLMDALYAQTPVMRLLRETGWDAVISLKRNLKELHESATRLFASRSADQTLEEKAGHKTYRVQIWDTEGLPFSIDNPEPVRVVRSTEELERNHYREGEKATHVTDHEWFWLTTLASQAFPAPLIRKLGHSRWKQENNGWMDLTQHWAFKHDYLHACKHRPLKSDAAGQRQPVPNRGLAAVCLIILIAFALTSAFVLRHSKLARLDHLTAVAVAGQLKAWILKSPPSIRAPARRP